MASHPRLHAMSVWLHLIPKLHTAGANNLFPAHNAFTGHDDPSLFTGVVRPSSFSHGYQVNSILYKAQSIKVWSNFSFFMVVLHTHTISDKFCIHVQWNCQKNPFISTLNLPKACLRFWKLLFITGLPITKCYFSTRGINYERSMDYSLNSLKHPI